MTKPTYEQLENELEHCLARVEERLDVIEEMLGIRIREVPYGDPFADGFPPLEPGS